MNMTVPTVQEFKNRITSTLKRYPYLAAIRDGRIIGYAYASQFKERAAYDWAVETSVYVSGDARRTGAGSLLYEALENYLRRQNVINVNACIAYPNPGSITFHENTATIPWDISPNAATNWASGGIWSGWKNAGPSPGTAGTFYTGRQALRPAFSIPSCLLPMKESTQVVLSFLFLHFLYCSIVSHIQAYSCISLYVWEDYHRLLYLQYKRFQPPSCYQIQV